MIFNNQVYSNSKFVNIDESCAYNDLASKSRRLNILHAICVEYMDRYEYSAIGYYQTFQVRYCIKFVQYPYQSNDKRYNGI